MVPRSVSEGAATCKMLAWRVGIGGPMFAWVVAFRLNSAPARRSNDSNWLQRINQTMRKGCRELTKQFEKAAEN